MFKTRLTGQRIGGRHTAGPCSTLPGDIDGIRFSSFPIIKNSRRRNPSPYAIARGGNDGSSTGRFTHGVTDERPYATLRAEATIALGTANFGTKIERYAFGPGRTGLSVAKTTAAAACADRERP